MLFSIIVPIYNVEKYLKQCVDSILSQTFADFELILVDDGSKDGCPQICDEYAKKDSRIKVIHKKNGGLISARKAGALEAEGEYIVPVDGDDWIDEKLLEKAKDILTRYDIDVFMYDYYKAALKKNTEMHCDFADGYYDKARLQKEIYPRLLRDEKGKRFPPNLCGKILKKDLYLKYQTQVDDRIKIGEDESVTFPCVYNANSVYILKECLYYYRQNESSMTKTRKQGYPWLDLELRVEQHKRLFPLNEYDFQAQLNRLIVHELFTIAKSHLRSQKTYKEAKKEIVAQFSQAEFQEAIENCFYRNNFKEKLAAFAVKHKKIFWIYLWAKLK